MQSNHGTRTFALHKYYCYRICIYLLVLLSIFHLFGNVFVNHSIIFVDHNNEHNKHNNNLMLIDIVYLWCNGSDIDYTNRRKKATQFLQNIENNDNDIIDYGSPPNSIYSPQTDRGELGLSLRSLYKYGIKNKNKTSQWVGNVYIVSDNGNVPDWLNHNINKLIIIDSNKLIVECITHYSNILNINNLNITHLQTYGTFNSHSMYLCLHKIRNLSQVFIQMDDDMLLRSEIYLNDIYDFQNKSGINWLRNVARNTRKAWSLPIEQEIADKLCDKKETVRIKWAPHLMRIWNKTKIEILWQLFPFKLLNTVNHLFRSYSDIDLTSFYPIYQYCYYHIPVKYIYHEIQLHLTPHVTIDDFKHINNTIHRINEQKQMAIQDFTHKWTYNYSSISVRILFILFSQYFDLKPSPLFEKYYKPKDCLKQHQNNYFNTKIMGHRGMGYTININNKYAENTLENFKYAYFKQNIKYIECDIALTSDHIIIVHHAHKLLWEGCKNKQMRYENKNININELTFEEIKRNELYWYDGNADNSISSLQEILLYFNKNHVNDIYFQIELKQNTNYNLAMKCNDKLLFNSSQCLKRYNDKNDKLVYFLVRLLKEIDFPLNRLIISSFEAPRLSNFMKQMGYKQKPNDIRLALITGDNKGRELTYYQAKQLIDSALHWKLTDISVFNKAVTQQFIEMCEINNIYSQIGMPGGSVCIHEIKQIHKGDSYGPLLKALMFNPDVICTNQPLLIQNIMQNITGQCPLFKLRNS